MDKTNPRKLPNILFAGTATRHGFGVYVNKCEANDDLLASKVGDHFFVKVPDDGDLLEGGCVDEYERIIFYAEHEDGSFSHIVAEIREYAQPGEKVEVVVMRDLPVMATDAYGQPVSSPLTLERIISRALGAEEEQQEADDDADDTERRPSDADIHRQATARASKEGSE